MVQTGRVCEQLFARRSVCRLGKQNKKGFREERSRHKGAEQGLCVAEFFFIVFEDEGVVAPRLSSSCTQKRITSARTSVLWAQHLPRRRLGRRPPCMKKLTQPRNINDLKFSQPVCIITIPVQVSHHNPLHAVPALPRWEKRPKSCNGGQKLTISQENWRNGVPLSPDGGITRPMRSDTSSPSFTASSCEHLCKGGLHA